MERIVHWHARIPFYVLGKNPHLRVIFLPKHVQRRIRPDTGGKLEYTLRIRSSGGCRGGNAVVDDDDDVDDIKLQMGRLVRETRGVIWVAKFLLDNIVDMKLMSFCERSGVVFFSACEWSYSSDRRYYMYRFRMDGKTVEKVASHVGWRDPWRDVHGYEMNQAAYLASLAPGDNEGGGIHDVDHPLSASSMKQRLSTSRGVSAVRLRGSTGGAERHVALVGR
ncbi:hypothetical protein EJB05_45853, partial [Eragrostis curvula]